MRGELLNVPLDEYVRDAFAPSPPSLSSRLAHILLTMSPRHCWHACPRLNPAWQPDDDRAFDLGTAAHAVLLEGRTLCVIDADDYRTKAAQQAREHAKATGGLPVLRHQAMAIEQMVTVAREKIACSPDLHDLGELLPERTLRWRERLTWLRCRPDWVTADHAVILSFKTTGGCAEPNTFARMILGCGYDVQAAFELAGLKAVTGVDAKYLWIVQETDPPYAVSLIGLSPMLYDLAHRKYRRAIELWARCMESGEWPAYPDRIAYIDPPAWAVSQWAEREMYADREEGIESL